MRAPLRTAALVAIAAGAVFAPQAWAAPPAPCAGTQITDAPGDGHHTNTDVTAAWLTESAGRLQAVVQVNNGLWAPAHEDSASAGVALLYELAGQTRYVRVQMFAGGAAPTFDQGTWTRAGGFASAGATGGALTTGAGGTVTLDVAAVAAGTVLARPFVLTYDGEESGQPHWVDRAPGATTPDDTAAGADFVAGSCAPAAPGTPTGPVTTTAVELKAPKKKTGGGTVTVSGTVTPARAGVTVAVTASARRSTTRTVTTGADGSFSLKLPLSETTRVRAVAEGRGSQTLTVQMYSKVRVKLRRLKSGTVVVSGTTSPEAGAAASCGCAATPSGPARAPPRATAASSSESSIPVVVATRRSSSRAAIAPSGPHPIQESSDEAFPRRGRPRDVHCSRRSRDRVRARLRLPVDGLHGCGAPR